MIKWIDKYVSYKSYADIYLSLIYSDNMLFNDSVFRSRSFVQVQDEYCCFLIFEL